MWVDIANLTGPRGRDGQDGEQGPPGPVNIGLAPNEPIAWDQSGGFTFNLVDGSQQTVNLPIASAQSAGLLGAGGALPDTGARDISSDVAGLTSGKLFIQRVGPIVEMMVHDAVFEGSGNRRIYNLPSGFWPTRTSSSSGARFLLGGAWGSASLEAVAAAFDTGGFWMSVTADRKTNGTGLWVSTESWPSSLPGTPG